MEDKKPNFLDLLAGECHAVAERFKLSHEQSDALAEFVKNTAMRSWRNGRAVGWARAQEGKPTAA